jgi:NAD-dependent deacetylase
LVLDALMSHVAPYNKFEPISIAPEDRVFVLTGAGISAESGIATFRDANGLWEQYRVEEVASPEGWRKDAEVVWRFYSERRAQAKKCAPNPAHTALARFEENLQTRLFLCTQNVDPLHERAGSRRAVHMHGELFKSRCESARCSSLPFVDAGEYRNAQDIPRCRCGARIRPHICWFGEVPFDMDLIADALEASTIFVTIGSSGAVYPAAGFVQNARSAGARTVYIGPEAPDNASAFDECRLGKASEAVPALIAL